MPPDLISQNSCLSGLATTARWRLAAEAAEAAVGVEKADSSRDDVDWSMVDLPLLKVGTKRIKFRFWTWLLGQEPGSKGEISEGYSTDLIIHLIPQR